MKIAILISLLLHLFIFLNISKDTKKKPKPNPKHKIAKKTKVKIKFTDMTKVGKKTCSNFYIGIGISYSRLLWEVLDVAPGGPAYFADIRVGDILLTNEKYEDLKINTLVKVTILRNGITITKKLKISKICEREE